jgi:pSer/pThr/pTyr-binding forkhead associated (FHA) protein
MQLEHGGQPYTVAADDVVIGSDPSVTVRLAGSHVLPRHAVVRRLGGGLLVVLPAVPEAEIRVNGARIGVDPTPLMHGDRIVIGGQEIRISDPARLGATRELKTARLPSDSGPAAGAPPPAPPLRAPAMPPASGGPAGSVGGRLVSLTDGREYPLGAVPFVFGRDATAEVVIASPDASRRHAEIVSRPDGDVLVDLSANGTHVNGKPIDGRHPLKALDVIRIGAEEFRYYPAAPKAEPAAPPSGAQYRLGDTLVGVPSFTPPGSRPPARSSTRPLASLLVKQGELKGERLAVRSPVVNIGRAEYNDLKLPDVSVSSSHAKLQLREGVWVLSDLGSTNGTFVDGVPVDEETALSPGCTLRVGEVGLLFEPQDESPARAPGTAVLERPVAAQAASAPAARAPSRAAARPAASPAGPPPAARNTGLLVLGVVFVLAALVALVLLL